VTDGAARVLVIEDHPLSRELVVAVLESLDCDVVAAESAEAGLALAQASPPDLILLDLRLPGWSGFEALHRIRAHPALHGVPVIAVTAQAMHGDEASVRRAGFDAYLSKPIDARRLRELVRDHLHSRHSS
jgi:two-component system cell cycle response regulator